MPWIESHSDIWGHWKTLALMRALGVSDVQAVGHLQSLWHFVLEHAWRDSDLSKWGDDGIEGAARWRGEPGAMVKALRDSGFLDGAIVHGWAERAGKLVRDRFYNEERRQKTVETNVDAVKRRKAVATLPYPTLPTERVRPQAASAAKAAPPHPIFDLWNKAEGLPRIAGASKKRLIAAKARWLENPDAAYWTSVINRIAASPFCKGENDRGWRAGIDWLLRPDTAIKVIEGAYDPKPGQNEKKTPAIPAHRCSVASFKAGTACHLCREKESEEKCST